MHDRLQWARRYVRLTRADWAAILFTDESRFKLFEKDGRYRVYRGGGSVMIWGGISMNTETAGIMIHGNLNAARYQNEVPLPVCIPHLQNNR